MHRTNRWIRSEFTVLPALVLLSGLLFSPPSSAQGQNKAKPPATAAAAEVAKVEKAMPQRARAEPARPRKILVFWRCEGFAHSCIPLASRTFEIMGKKTGAFDVVFSDRMAAFEPDVLDRFDAVLFNNTTRLAFSNPEHRKALMDFVKSGKGLIGIHAASDNFYEWPEAAEMMGGLFDGHPWTADGTWAVRLDEPGHPLNRAFDGRGFLIKDEIYQVKDPYSREKLRVLLSLDTTAECNRKVRNPGATHRKDLDFAIAWIRTFGKGRVFYCSLGHNHEVYWNPAVLKHYLDGIQYALGDLEVDDTPSALSKKEILPADAAGESVSLFESGDFSAFRDNTGDWIMAGKVYQDPDDERKLAFDPGAAEAVNGERGATAHLFTERSFGDIGAHIEFMVPKGSNSGVYFQGRYEIQVLDSYGVEEPKFSDCGGIYQRWHGEPDVEVRGYEGRPPKVNASRKPGEWQTFDVIFRAPRLDESGKKIANALFVQVKHNGVMIHENQEVTGPTRAAAFKDEQPLGPLMIQGDHGPVAYRNIRITPLEKKTGETGAERK